MNGRWSSRTPLARFRTPLARFRTPLAWANLVDSPRRLLLAAAGVGFAVVLMFSQVGFLLALLDSPGQLISLLRCDLVAISTARYTLPVSAPVDRSLLLRAAGDRRVAAVESLRIERLASRVRVAGEAARPIQVIAVPHRADDWLKIDGLASHTAALRQPGAALLDRKTRRHFRLADRVNDPPPARPVELSGHRIELIGKVTIGTDFANEGTLLVSPETFAELFPFRGRGNPLGQFDVGLIRLIDAVRNDERLVQQTAADLTAIAGRQWQVMTPGALITREANFWRDQTPIGKIFSVGTAMGFAVGIIICYQILYTSLQDSMAEFATLKAMGYPSGYFVGLVSRQAVYLSLIGFVPAMAVVALLFFGLESISGLPMKITLPRSLMILAMTIVMCLISGMLALRKLLRADPASLF